MKTSMRINCLLLLLILFQQAGAQTPEELASHRLQYKTDLFNDIGADTSKVDFFPFSARFIITATVELLENEPVFKMTTSSGVKKDARRYARISFKFNGKTYNCYGYQLTSLQQSAEYASHFFVPFRDLTNGISTYSAGRYLDFTATDIKNGKLALDFNKAYNPYCAFTDGFNCPIPPAENNLALKVNAGEKKFLGERTAKPVSH
ncbi:MAG TPA: DUF1684 domain-containing protein [Chitinophagaceae bacterium]